MRRIKTTPDRLLAMPALRGAIDSELMELMASTNSSFNDTRMWMERNELLIVPFLERKQLSRLRDAFFRLWPRIANLQESESLWAKLKKRAGLKPRGCEICGHGQSHLLRILKYPGNWHAGWSWDRVWSHPACSVRLCSRAILEIEKTPARASLSELARDFVGQRKRLNILLRKEVRGELARIRAAEDRARLVWRRVERSARSEVDALAAEIRELG